MEWLLYTLLGVGTLAILLIVAVVVMIFLVITKPGGQNQKLGPQEVAPEQALGQVYIGDFTIDGFQKLAWKSKDLGPLAKNKSAKGRECYQVYVSSWEMKVDNRPKPLEWRKYPAKRRNPP